MNYKPTEQIIACDSVRTKVPNGTTVKYLSDYVGGSSVADGMMYETLIYQVTTGKTFRCLGILLTCNTTGGAYLVISEGATEDAETTEKVRVQTPYQANIKFWIPTDFEIASAKFITYNPSFSDIASIAMVGYEY